MEPIRLSGRVVDFERGEVHAGAERQQLTSREVELLAYLANHAGEPVSRDELHTEVWGMAPTVKSRAVDFTLHRLRGKIEANPSDPRHLLKVQGVGYKLVVDDETGPYAPSATVLAGHVHRLPQLWRSHADQTDRQLMSLRRQVAAVASRLGGTVCRSHPPLVVFPAVDAALAAARRLQQQPFLPVTLALASGEVSWWVEGAHADVHGWTADRAELLARSFQPGSVVLDDSTAVALQTRGLDAQLIDLGKRVLEELPEALHVFRASSPSTPERQAVGSRRTTNLWHHADRLFGRGPSRDQIVSLLQDETVGCLALWGPAGVGKTRLAREAALAWSGARKHVEVWFCDLRPATSMDEVLIAIAAPTGLPPDLHRAARALGARGDILLILDNAEHVTQTIERIMQAWTAPGVRLMVTSRARVGGAVEVAVEPLSPSAARDLLLDRARCVRPGFGDDDPASVASIVTRLGALPLPIELAAARARWMNAKQMLVSLSQASADNDPMAQALDWSWAQLDETERAVLAALSVFPASLTLDDAEAVTGRDDVAEHVAALRDWSLLDEVDDVDQPRVALFDVVRRHAAIRARADGTFDGAAQRYAAAVLARAARALAALHGPGEAAAIQALARDLPDLLTVAQRARASGDRDVGGAAIVAMAPLLGRIGPVSLLKELVEPAVPDAEERDPRVGLGLLRAAWMVWSQDGRTDAAVQVLQRSIVLAQRCGDEVQALLAETRLARTQDPVEEQEVKVGGWVRRLEDLGAYGTAGVCALSLANAFALSTGDLERARPWYHRALALHRRGGNRRAEGVVLANLADLRRHVADWSGAASEARAASELLEEAGDRRNQVSAMGIVGFSLAAAGSPEQGQRVLERALALARRAGGEQDELAVLGNLAEVLLLADDLDAAEQHAEEAAELARTLGLGWFADHCLAVLACIRWCRGERSAAIGDLERAVRRMERSRPDGTWRATLAALLAVLGRLDEARAALGEPPEPLVAAWVHAQARADDAAVLRARTALEADPSWMSQRLGRLL